jgi:predicted secreted protein
VLIIDIRQHRKTIDLHCGDRFLIRLAEDPDLGYTWRTNKTHGLVFADHWFAPAETSRLLAGSLHYWGIRATTAGRHFFRAIYQGPEENSFSRRLYSSSRSMWRLINLLRARRKTHRFTTPVYK